MVQPRHPTAGSRYLWLPEGTYPAPLTSQPHLRVSVGMFTNFWYLEVPHPNMCQIQMDRIRAPIDPYRLRKNPPPKNHGGQATWTKLPPLDKLRGWDNLEQDAVGAVDQDAQDMLHPQ